MPAERKPLVSVVMPVYNGEKFVAEAIESILAQTFGDFDFIIVDDGSVDRSAEIVRAYAESDDRIRLLQSERNAGAAVARNRALAIASGEFIAMMDSDDLSLPERFQRQLDMLRERPDIGVLGTGARAVDQQLAPLYDFRLPEAHALIVFNLFVGSFIINPTVMLRRELLDAVGGYTPDWRVAEDTELWSRLMWRARFANLPETHLLYRRHAAQLSMARDAATTAQSWEVRARLLQRLWGRAPRETLLRFEKLRQDSKLNWRERRAAREDLRLLAEALISQGVVDEVDEALVAAHARACLEATTPRLWQMFLHWRRHHFGSGNSERAN